MVSEKYTDQSFKLGNVYYYIFFISEPFQGNAFLYSLGKFLWGQSFKIIFKFPWNYLNNTWPYFFFLFPKQSRPVNSPMLNIIDLPVITNILQYKDQKWIEVYYSTVLSKHYMNDIFLVLFSFFPLRMGGKTQT